VLAFLGIGNSKIVHYRMGTSRSASRRTRRVSRLSYTPFSGICNRYCFKATRRSCLIRSVSSSFFLSYSPLRRATALHPRYKRACELQAWKLRYASREIAACVIPTVCYAMHTIDTRDHRAAVFTDARARVVKPRV